MKKLEVHFAQHPESSMVVGTLAEDRGRIYFEYASDFLATDLNLSPFHLPFGEDLFQHKDLEFGPLPGLFDDSLPDGWGRLLMDRNFRSLGMNPAEISPLDRLSWLGHRTMGALTYHPSSDTQDRNNNAFDLHDLSRQSEEVLSGSVMDILPQLLRAGGSPCGARPKVLAGFNPNSGRIISGEDDLPNGFEHWIVKFFGQADGRDAGAIEYAYSLMARQAGINIPPTRIFETSEGDRFFGIKRFDRDGDRRFHVHTFGNLIQSNFRIPSADYSDLLKATSLLTHNHQEVLQNFRRMVFNVLAHNRDDHVKNFAFLMDDKNGEWRVSPAYDLLFTSGPGGEHTMTVAGEGRKPGRVEFLKLAKEGGISSGQVNAIIEEVQEAVDCWGELSEMNDVSPEMINQIADSFPVLK